jgi:transcription elongation factor
MKAKAGKYARYKNILGLIFDDNVTETQIAIKTMSYNFMTLLDKDKVKVANDPRELVECDDMIRRRIFIGSDRIETKSIPLAVSGNMKDKVMIYADSMFISHSDIVEILTPKGKDYICQWEAE